jgi:outer membrane protein OmpA-like peptidoglycan-associated protein
MQAKRALEAEAMNQFLQAFPKSPHATEAAVRLTELKKLIAADPPVSIEEEGAWRQLAEFKAGNTFRDLSARQRLEAERTALSEFKNKYPKSRHGQEINARLAELETLIAKDASPSSEEAMAWIYLNSLEAERISQKTPDQKRMVFEANGLDEFIRRFPSSQHAVEARSRRERLEKQIRTALLPTTVPGSEAQLAEDEKFIATLRVQPIQPLTARQRERLTAIAGKRTSLDLEIPFEYNSADIGPQALPVLRALGRVLSKDEFRKSTILVGGHTDAAGNDEYNLALSERRAEAVKRLLIREFDLSAANLIAAGFGKGHLKNKSKPLADENRRVGFVNMSTK